MAKQRFSKQDVELIKHWASKGTKHGVISQMMNCSRSHITRILNKQRWAEVEKPNHARGEELHWRFMQYGTLNTHV
jgi:hypothetical protein